MTRTITALLALILALGLAGCGSDADPVDDEANTAAETEGTETEATDTDGTEAEEGESEGGDDPGDASSGSSTFVAEVWADNWFALYANGQLVGEDSVPITTERSFNAETITFEATYPLTLAIEAKDFKETDSGIEYIGERNQQMGDGGLIAQITDTATGEVIAVTDGNWSALVIHRAPLNTECVTDDDPDATCTFEAGDAPTGWADPDFDDSAWTSATEWSADAVDPKDGYDQISWDGTAQLIWGSDLEVDNTVLVRLSVP
ncbi:MAG: PEBP family protein [Actinomycetota bacterium]